MDSVVEVVDMVYRAEAYSHRFQRVVLLVSLDDRNIFNPVPWADILGALENSSNLGRLPFLDIEG